MQELINALYYEGHAFSGLEIIGVITALIYVGLAAKGNRWCFLFGLISSAVYIYLSLVLKFYFDTAINTYYIVMSFYGWFAWGKTDSSSDFIPQKLKSLHFALYIVVGSFVTISLAYAVSKYSDAALPYFDAFTTIFAIIATYMVVKKWIENWLIWVVVDTVAAGMYWYKELYLTALLFFIYTIISIIGYQKWKKQLV
ncbi:MAG: nicotinamide riboside transporter PnuC [Vicingaceae bacterium]